MNLSSLGQPVLLFLEIVVAFGTILTPIVMYFNRSILKPMKSIESEQKKQTLSLNDHSTTLDKHSLILKELQPNGGGTMKDVVKKIDRKLDTLNSLIEAGMELDNYGIFITDALGSCKYVNKRYQEITGLTFHEALNHGWVNAIHPNDKEKILKVWNESVQSKSNASITYRYKNNKIRRVLNCRVSWQVKINPEGDDTLLIFGKVELLERKTPKEIE